MSKQKNMTGQIATLKKVMHYLKHYIPILILSVVLATVTVALTLYFPILTGRAIDWTKEMWIFRGFLQLQKKEQL